MQTTGSVKGKEPSNQKITAVVHQRHNGDLDLNVGVETEEMGESFFHYLWNRTGRCNLKALEPRDMNVGVCVKETIWKRQSICGACLVDLNTASSTEISRKGMNPDF